MKRDPEPGVVVPLPILSGPQPVQRATDPPVPMRRTWLRRFLAVAGPGLVVMLADTDAGSVITAAQSGAQWGYQLLALQFLLIPVLFIAQELTVRLGIVSGQGHGQLIARHFGRAAAWFSVGTLLLACVGAVLSELSGLAGVGLMYGIPSWLTMAVVFAGLTVMVYSGSYLSVERIAMVIGAFELVFLVVAWKAHPAAAAVLGGLVSVPWRDPSYLYLVSANIGAVVMPWMIFYQQSAVVEKGLTLDDLRAARWDTAVGAVATQVIMAAVLVATAAALGAVGHTAALESVQQIADAIAPAVGEGAARILFGMGMSGAALVATIVVTLTAARSVGEVLGLRHSLDYSPREAPWFYAIYTGALALGAAVVASGTNLVRLSVGVQVMNALLLPIVLGFLYLLARRQPPPYRQAGPYAWVVAVVITLATLLGVYAGISGLW